jgi:UrcA family protein
MTTFNHASTFRSRLPLVLVLGALAFTSAGAQADEPGQVDQVTISAPSLKTVGRDQTTGAPIEEVSKQASIKFDPVTLTTNSGVALLKDSVFESALQICNSIGLSMSDDDGRACVRDAVKSAQVQVDAAIARARSSTNG